MSTEEFNKLLDCIERYRVRRGTPCLMERMVLYISSGKEAYTNAPTAREYLRRKLAEITVAGMLAELETILTSKKAKATAKAAKVICNEEDMRVFLRDLPDGVIEKLVDRLSLGSYIKFTPFRTEKAVNGIIDELWLRGFLKFLRGISNELLRCICISLGVQPAQREVISAFRIMNNICCLEPEGEECESDTDVDTETEAPPVDTQERAKKSKHVQFSQ